MYSVEDIENLIEKWAPKSLCCEGDNVGLLVGRKNADVKGVLVAFEVTSDIIDEAIEKGANLIVCHHPLIFYPLLNRVTDCEYVQGLVLRLIENHISLIAAHTNLDWAENGVTQTLAENLGIEIIDNLKENEGVYGNIEPRTLMDFANDVKDELSCPHLKYVGENQKLIKTVAVVSGGGGDYIKYALEHGCDAFVSADFKYHQAHMAYENDIAIIDAGHFETENIILSKVYDYLCDNTNGVHIFLSSRNKSFYKYI
ncbi:MAG: Nif3-like dinuclear metal center hexameric protein [Eubacteriales bacterium]|nr:Nif3-like dinuclear metal center hexameric protein [Eubacteriales bacterium]